MWKLIRVALFLLPTIIGGYLVYYGITGIREISKAQPMELLAESDTANYEYVKGYTNECTMKICDLTHQISGFITLERTRLYFARIGDSMVYTVIECDKELGDKLEKLINGELQSVQIEGRLKALNDNWRVEIQDIELSILDSCDESYIAKPEFTEYYIDTMVRDRFTATIVAGVLLIISNILLLATLVLDKRIFKVSVVVLAVIMAIISIVLLAVNIEIR